VIAKFGFLLAGVCVLAVLIDSIEHEYATQLLVITSVFVSLSVAAQVRRHKNGVRAVDVD
jgi:hypothetical protein